MLGFGGGVYYARLNDNFHDFFTEYIPFGEDAVLYLEEREFRQRYHSKANRGKPPRDTGDQIKIPSQSGVSWRVADEKSSGRHSSAVTGDSVKPGEAAQNPLGAQKADKVAAVEKAKAQAKGSDTKPAPAPESKPTLPPASKSAPEPTSASISKPAHPVTKEAEPKISSSTDFKAPEVNEPSRLSPKITRVDPINIKDAKEPVVQDLVKIINDIITVVNADNADARFSTSIGKAKSELSKVGNKIKALKDAAQQEADQKVKEAHEDFDRGAKQLIQRISEEVEAQEAAFKQEYESERRRIQENYEQKLKSEVEQANKVNEQRLRNELLEQAIFLKRNFTAEVKARVEEERNGRLSKLSDLTNTVTELEKLTTDWNSVVDSNLQTQHLHVAVEAVRANLEKSEIPRPFVRELAALKEIASEDPVVNAAIASINPTAYQRGIPSSAQLIDRFRRVASEVRKASLLPNEAGVASHVSSFVLSKLLFKKKGVAMGDDVESVLTRTETFLEEGDLDAAAREMNVLKGWAKTLSSDWLGEVRRVLEVRQALDVSLPLLVLKIFKFGGCFTRNVLTMMLGNCYRGEITKFEG